MTIRCDRDSAEKQQKWRHGSCEHEMVSQLQISVLFSQWSCSARATRLCERTLWMETGSLTAPNKRRRASRDTGADEPRRYRTAPVCGPTASCIIQASCQRWIGPLARGPNLTVMSTLDVVRAAHSLVHRLSSPALPRPPQWIRRDGVSPDHSTVPLKTIGSAMVPLLRGVGDYLWRPG